MNRVWIHIAGSDTDAEIVGFVQDYDKFAQAVKAGLWAQVTYPDRDEPFEVNGTYVAAFGKAI